MGICCELEEGFCGGSVRNTVCTGLTHYMIHGVFILCFAFSNFSYPVASYPDYIFGGCGAALFLTSLIAMCAVDLRDCQFLRGFTAFLVVVAMAATVGATFYYTIMRWNDIMVTAISYAIRKPLERDLPDFFWFSLVVTSCLVSPLLIVFSVYIISFMWNEWESNLFTMPYMNNMNFAIFGPPIFPPDAYSRPYRPQYVQQN